MALINQLVPLNAKIGILAMGVHMSRFKKMRRASFKVQNLKVFTAKLHSLHTRTKDLV